MRFNAAKPTVRIDAGLIRGAPSGDPEVVGFKGVPYARPPVGGLRWRPPEPVAPWAGVRDATGPGPACPQPTTPPAAFYTIDPPRTDEDCLYGNIWAPRGGRDRPVMVWTHGVAFIREAGSEPWYDGARLAAKGAVVITIDYRLGLFGYFAHPAFNAESPRGVSGNYGLLDQIAALRWLKRNAAAFGGYPTRVTVFGESAGALSVAELMASPLAAGPFERAIARSVYIPAMPELRTERFGLPAAETVGTQFGRQVGAADLAALRAVPATALLAAPNNPYHMIGGHDRDCRRLGVAGADFRDFRPGRAGAGAVCRGLHQRRAARPRSRYPAGLSVRSRRFPDARERRLRRAGPGVPPALPTGRGRRSSYAAGGTPIMDGRSNGCRRRTPGRRARSG